MPKVSVVIPVYNVEKFLPACIGSAVNQTLGDIEIICVNDASTDGCLNILQSFAEKDSRVKAISFSENKGKSQARKDGVLASTGEYVMFLDGDDEYFPNACETAYNAIKKLNTDMVHFDTEVVNSAGFPEQAIEAVRNFVAPYKGVIHDASLAEKVWKEQSFRFTIWNKIYNGNICRKAFSEVLDGYYPKAQDLYAFFIIAHHSKSYAGIPDRLYKYRFGTGISGSDILPFRKYEITLLEKKVCDALSDWASMNAPDSYSEILNIIHDNLLDECIFKWVNNLAASDLSEGFAKLCGMWGSENVITRMAAGFWDCYFDLGKKLQHVEGIRHVPRQEKKTVTVAVYQGSTDPEGDVTRIASDLCRLWASAADAEGNKLFRVILIADDGYDAKEDSPAREVIREFLPPAGSSAGVRYRERYRAWTRILDQHMPDVVISASRDDPCTFWDMLTVKSHPSQPAFTLLSPLFCADPYRDASAMAGIRHLPLYMLSDGVAVFTEADRKYAEAFCSNVSCINYPSAAAPDGMPESTCSSHVLLWQGKITPENRPLDVIRMMSLLVQEMPDARLCIIGTGDMGLLSEMSSLIRNLGLGGNIEIAAPVAEADKYYSAASVFISTCKSECRQDGIIGAKARAIPVVSYDFPWLQFIEDGRGVLTAEPGRYDELAEKAEYLLKHPEEARKTGSEGKQQLAEICRHSTAGDWKSFFDRAMKSSGSVCQSRSSESIVLRSLALYQYEGRRKEEEGFAGQIAELGNQLNALRSANARQAAIIQSPGHAAGISTLWRPGFIDLLEYRFRRHAVRHKLRELRDELSEFCKEKSDLWEPEYYGREYPDVAKAWDSLSEHYMKNGWKENRNPSAKCRTDDYLAVNPDCALLGISPLEHYFLCMREGRPVFWSYEDMRKYASEHGMEILRKSAYFDPEYCRKSYEKKHGSVPEDFEPYSWYLEHGASDAVRPCRHFRVHWYSDMFPYIRTFGICPVVHDELWGRYLEL